jgi:hypothetical protein
MGVLTCLCRNFIVRQLQTGDLGAWPARQLRVFLGLEKIVS